VSIVVVTYNSAEYLAPFVESVYRNTTYPRVEVIIWDNASTDHSREVLKYLAEKFPSLKLRLSDRNLGFAGGNNRAVREASGEYIVVINPDTLVTPGWVDRLLRPLREDPSVGAVAPVTNFSGNETRIETDYRNRTEMEHFALRLAREKFGSTMKLQCAPLLCVLSRRSLWEELEGLDERYEVGMFEDDDFCLRIRRAGYEIVTAEDCFIHHFGSSSFGKLPSEQAEALFNENRKRFEAKWGVTWKPHAPRPGVKPLSGAERIPVALFMEGQTTSSAAVDVPLPRILKLHPEFAHVGQRVNEQPDGTSALVIECSNATPVTIILWNGTPLTTTFGSDNLMSGVLPEGFSKRPGEMEVRLANDFGISVPAVFRVLAA
jgi:GT2 family glycosyltransferase